MKKSKTRRDKTHTKSGNEKQEPSHDPAKRKERIEKARIIVRQRLLEYKANKGHLVVQEPLNGILAGFTPAKKK